MTERGGKSFPDGVIQRSCCLQVGGHYACGGQGGTAFGVELARAEVEGNAASTIRIKQDHIIRRFCWHAPQIISPILDRDALTRVKREAKETASHCDDDRVKL